MEEAKHHHDEHEASTHGTDHQNAHKLPTKLPTFSALPQLEEWLEEYLGQKAPQLPQHWRQTIAKFAPWVTLIVFVLALPLIFGIFGLSVVVFSGAAMAGLSYGAWGWFTVLITIASLVLELVALPGLFKRSKQGWIFIFYAALIGAAAHILSFNLGSLIGDILSLYIIFQIKNQYK
jgi:hypothetical protein